MSKGRRKHSPALTKVVLQAVKGEKTDPDDAAPWSGSGAASLRAGYSAARIS